MGKATLNGKTYNIPDGASINIQGDQILVNGQRIDQISGTADVVIKIEGGCGSVKIERGSVEVSGDVNGTIDSGGSVTVGGKITGHVDAGGSVTCGDVGDCVKAGGSVRCGRVSGDVDAGGSVHCASSY